MNNLVAYLLAQARHRPVATAKFAAGEIWRRSRLRLQDRLEEGLPSFSTYRLKSRFAAFYPARAMDAGEFESRFPGAAEKALEQAEKIHRHEFEIFGERVEYGAEIDWHADWKTGYRWPVRKAGQLRILNGDAGTDVKRPWELARFHHLLALGRAYLLTREQRYAEEFARQVLHFAKNNPCARGIHWAMPMEAAIRGVNWIAAGAFFAGDDSLDEAFWKEFLRGLFVHGRFVYAQREWNPVARGNHYLACIVALLHIGAFFDDQPEAQQWYEFARKEFCSEMRAQVREDGVAHEGSSGYHVFSTELFLSGAMVLARAEAARGDAQSGNFKFQIPDFKNAETEAPDAWAALAESCGKGFAERLEKMFEFIAALTAGREHPPILGDSDDGRLLPFCAAEGDGTAHLLAVGRTLFGREDWPPASHTCEEIWWRLGMARGGDAGLPRLRSGQVPPGATKAAEKRRVQRAGAPACAAFRTSGYFFFSSARLRGSVRCGPLGINGWANHAHCDQLSVEFACEGRPVVVDPGTYLYSGDGGQRNLFRSTKYHNSVVVDGGEQNRFWPGLLFRIVDDTRSKTRQWDADEATVLFHGEHSGYRGVQVARRVAVDRQNNLLAILDTVKGSGTRRLEWFFHLAPGIAPELARISNLRFGISKAERGGLKQELGDKTELAETGDLLAELLERVPEAQGLEWSAAWRIGPVVMLAGTSAGKLEASVERGWVAPRYGKREEAAVVKFRCEGKLPASAAFAFVPAG